MSDKDIASDSLKDIDIWFDNGNINGFKVTSILEKYIKNGKYSSFDELHSILLEQPYIAKIQQRLINIKNQYDGLSLILKNFSDSNFREIKLSPFEDKASIIDASSDLFQMEAGLYERPRFSELIDEFENNFDYLEDSERNFLKERGFAQRIPSLSVDRFRVMEGVRLHNFHHYFYSASDSENRFDMKNAARLAKLSCMSFVSEKVDREIDKAIILPFDHACHNYYHNLSENISGLRFLEEFPDDMPIIYSEDYFRVIDFVASRLFIDKSRLIPLKDCTNVLVRKALLLYPINFYWDSDIYKFWRNISYPVAEKKKIYISRRGSSRSPSNEEEIEGKLASLGFSIERPEKLSFKKQVELFSNADFLISPHGAGLTNIVFMPKGSKIIEIFNNKFVTPDYFLRSRHNGIKYKCYLQDSENINFDNLLELINSLNM